MTVVPGQIVGLLTFLLILIIPANVFAVGNIHYGGTELHPAITLSYRYDDNVYLTDGDMAKKTDDSLYVISPSVELKRSHDSRIYSLTYKADIYRYSEETKEDKETHTGTAYINTRVIGGLKLMLRDTYVKTADPASSELTDMDERTQNLFQCSLGSNVIGRLSFSLKYSNTRHKYEDDFNKSYLEKYDRTEEAYGGEFTLALLPKTSFFLEYSQRTIAYDDVIAGDLRDSESDYVFLGVKGQLTSKSAINLGVGYAGRDYEASDKEDINSLVVSLTFDYQYSSRTRLSLTGKKDITESFFSSAAGNYNYYVENLFSLKVPVRISNKVASSFGVFYGINEYNETALGGERKDNLFGGSVDLNYNIKSWLKTGVAYNYKERNSDIDSEDYQNNQYTAYLSAEF